LRVDGHPTFSDLVFGDSEQTHPAKRHFSTGRCETHELTVVGTATRPKYCHHVSFGHYLLYSILDVWKGGAVNADVLLQLFDTTLMLVGQVLDELSAKYLVCRIEIYSVPQVLELATCERLVLLGCLFGHLFLFFVRRRPPDASAQSSAWRGLGTFYCRRTSENSSSKHSGE
jgi:hypothetical protein